MNLHRIAARVADNFSTKMRLNAFVLDSVVNEVDPSADPESLQNDVAVFLLKSNIHELIGKLADAISSEAREFKKTQKKVA